MTPAPCHDCAFTPGTEAHASGWTRIKADLCVVAGEPFYCHARGTPQPLCAGYLNAAENAPEQPEWRRNVAVAALRIQATAEESPDHAEFIEEHFEDVFDALLAIAEEPCDVCGKEFDARYRVRMDGLGGICPACVRDVVTQVIVQPRCPACGSVRLAVSRFDNGVDWDTGYDDSGETCRCEDCGASGEPGDFEPSRRTMELAEKLSGENNAN